ncbi:40S ribosomal protein S6 (Fragment) [Linum grandiflorum]
MHHSPPSPPSSTIPYFRSFSGSSDVPSLTRGFSRKSMMMLLERHNGKRRREYVRGCIIRQNPSVINLLVKKKGENDLPKLTDTEKPRMSGSGQFHLMNFESS